MPQIFGRGSNAVVRAFLVGGAALVGLMGCGVWAVWWSPYMTRVGVAVDQPVPFSHEHHVAGLGIDCRYCHVTVEYSDTAGLPPTETCMTCHSQVWTEAPVLAPVRQSWATRTPLRWNRVHDVPDFVFFNHSIHVQKGIGCSSCHGRVDAMPLLWQEYSLYMKWCLDCHREPERFVRPKALVFDMAWRPPTNQFETGRQLVQEYRIAPPQYLTDCSMCHR